MKAALLILVIFLFAGTAEASAQSLNCGRFKTGTFLYFSANNDLIKVKRKRTRQAQFNLTKKIFAGGSHIKWVNDCSFKMVNDNAPAGFPPAVVTITPLTDSTFRSVCSCGINDTVTWMLFDKKKFNIYKKTHEAL